MLPECGMKHSQYRQNLYNILRRKPATGGVVMYKKALLKF